MTDEQRVAEIEKIKELEREVYERRCKLASEQAMQGLPHSIAPLNWGQWQDLIRQVGELSGGGASVADVQRERER